MQKIVIEYSMNQTPEDQLAKRLTPLLAKGYQIISATTSLVTHGTHDYEAPGVLFYGVAKHVYYVTTVVLRKPSEESR